MEKNTFINAESSEKFTATSQCNIDNTVFKNIDPKKLIKHDDYVTLMANQEITHELLLTEFNPSNPNLRTAKFLFLPRIVDNYELVKFANENKLLSPADCSILFLNLIVCFNSNVNLDTLSYVAKKNIDIVSSKITFETIIELIKKEINGDEIILLDWYYQMDPNLCSHLLSYLIAKTNSDKIFSYICNKPTTILTNKTFELLKIICCFCDLEKVKQTYEKIQITDEVISKDIINSSLLNPHRDVALYMLNICNDYKCTDVGLIFSFLGRKDFEITKQLYDKFEGQLNDMDFINFIYTKNDLNILTFIAENTKVNIHVNENALFKFVLCDENFIMLKYLLDNDEKLGTFYNEKDKEHIKKIIKFIVNKNILELLKTKYNIIKV